MFKNPLFSKTMIIFLLALMLMIPLTMIQSKISERQILQHDVQQDIARSASGPQTLGGPYLVLRYRQTIRNTIKEKDGSEKVAVSYRTCSKIIKPHTLNINGNADVEMRSRGIYQARLFNLNALMQGSFIVAKGYGLDIPLSDLKPLSAYFVMNVSDARGIRNAPELTLNDKSYHFKPGTGTNVMSGNGMHVPMNRALSMDQSHKFQFSFSLELQGMSRLSVMPSGSTTEVSLSSSWPHPSFGGSYLPRSRTIRAEGFSAQWLVTNLARNQGSKYQDEAFSVDFIDPVNVYLLSERAVKYGILFVVLVFAGFFMFELLRKLRIHPMQYLLVGLALAVFFLLIISLSEHIPFAAAYTVSGAACALLIGIYLAGVLGSYKPALLFTVGIALLYAVLYGVLQSEDNALLMGTLLIFSALTAVMVLSRNMDWYSFSAIQKREG